MGEGFEFRISNAFSTTSCSKKSRHWIWQAVGRLESKPSEVESNFELQQIVHP
jgi:hypothetical protein